MLDPKQTVISYRCPHCGKNILSVVGIFALSGDLMKLKCDCGESELVIERTKEGKIRLTVPCFLCPKPHIYSVSSDLLFARELFSLGCAYAGILQLSLNGCRFRKVQFTAKRIIHRLHILENCFIYHFWCAISNLCENSTFFSK